MGLDMYLMRRERDDRTAEEWYADLENLDYPEPWRSNWEGVQVGYWRKANEIHAWFVRNVQDGVDECQLSPVTFQQLIDLRDACKAVLADPARGPELLPTQAGFFFGGTEYNEYYLGDLNDTIVIIDKVLAEPSEAHEILYHSSW